MGSVGSPAKTRIERGGARTMVSRHTTIAVTPAICCFHSAILLQGELFDVNGVCTCRAYEEEGEDGNDEESRHGGGSDCTNTGSLECVEEGHTTVTPSHVTTPPPNCRRYLVPNPQFSFLSCNSYHEAQGILLLRHSNSKPRYLRNSHRTIRIGHSSWSPFFGYAIKSVRPLESFSMAPNHPPQLLEPLHLHLPRSCWGSLPLLEPAYKFLDSSVLQKYFNILSYVPLLSTLDP